MSIKLMSAIFDAEFHDMQYIKDGQERTAKASTLKLVLLAIADHANDQGESAYPGYTLLTTKTALSRQGLADTIDALEYNGLLSIDDKPSKLQTNSYTINLRSLPAIAKELPDIVKPLDQSSHLTSASQATGLGVVKPLDLNHQLTTNKPSAPREKKQKPDLVDGWIEFSQSPGMKKQLLIDEIENKIATRLHINPSGDRWLEFIKYAAERQIKDRQSIDTFLNWALDNGYNPVYWTAGKMREMWPQAFVVRAEPVYPTSLPTSQPSGPTITREEYERIKAARI